MISCDIFKVFRDFSKNVNSSDVECTVPQKLSRALLTREASACVRQRGQYGVKQELPDKRHLRTGERERLGRGVKQKWTGERKRGEEGRASQSQTGERREGKLMVGETGQERCETRPPQKCKASAKVLKRSMLEPQMM